MPRPQVYGKRSRAIFNNNHAIFDSPERRNPYREPVEPAAKPTDDGNNNRTRVPCNAKAPKNTAGVLGHVDANAVALPAKLRQGRRSKLGMEGIQVEVVEQQKFATPLRCAIPRNDEDGTVPMLLVNHARAETPGEAQKLCKAEDCLAVSDCCEPIAHGIVEELLTEEPRPLHEAHHHEIPSAETHAVPDRVQADNVYSRHCSELLDLSNHPISSLAEWSDELSQHFTIAKIAEASFGEVYRLSLIHRLPGLDGHNESVFKMIALQPPVATLPTTGRQHTVALKKMLSMSRPDDVANEVKLLQRMSSIPGFTLFRDVRVLQGRPPKRFIEAFKAFNVEQKARHKDRSIFPDPGKRSSYSDKQLWAVIEMQDAGSDLERFIESGECHSVFAVWDVFWQVVLSLAKGEEAAEFEHRDLHLGNICVRLKAGASCPQEANGIDVKRKLGFTDLETTIIDYTISRCLLSAQSDKAVAYQDLALDRHLFAGDAEADYQYAMYRHMRSAVYANDPMASITKERTAMAAESGTWQQYHPITNLVWLHFILYKLLEQLDWPSAKRAPPKRQKLAHAEWKRANDLEHKLLKMQGLLNLETGLCKNGMRLASDAVALALTEGWLDVEDVIGGMADGLLEDQTLRPAEHNEMQAEDITEQLTHLQINVDVIEKHGLEIAEREARAGRHRSRRCKT
ncbi:hypothetical protein BAUCODRAFT_212712 [Baudoinia panamericana UAMH 10762]|uniref:non-specific serine/threonine protein kinase n=1 Tax=Baudoinia panamericana (strain UAMH 10762) TaxID=717646 RepID=M2MBI4_BAUPA|nr:uncharacterized protein BAUCODRAFT_212712 [Baudoinia panamericana UAMH 10762]EMC93871.1 hypothetical protein BAUCODRAFT_212712 [Baudoinia panamericana UAMH 10762]